MSNSSQRTVSIRLLLFVAFLLPVLSLGSLAGSRAYRQQQDATRAQRTAEEIAVLSNLAQHQFAMKRSVIFAQMTNTVGPLIDGLVSRDDAAEGLDSVLERTEEILENPQVLNDLTNGQGADVLRRAYRFHKVGPPQSELDNTGIPIANRQLLGDLELTVRIATSNADAEAVRRTVAFGTFNSLQVEMLKEAETFISLLDGGNNVAAVEQLVSSAALTNALVTTLMAQLPTDLASELRTDMADRDMVLLRQAILAENGFGASSDTFTGLLDAERLGRIQVRYIGLSGIADRYAQGLAAEATAEAEQARRSLHVAAAVLVVIVALLGTVALLLGRTVSRRLHQLSEAASRIRDGEISAEPLQTGSLREVAAVTQAFNEMSLLLRTLDEQVAAIGSNNVDADVLSTALPGRIGRDIQRSVTLITDTTRELRASQVLSEAIISSAVDGIVTVDEHGVIQSANPAAVELCGISPAPLPGKALAEVLEQLPRLDLLVAEEDDIAATVVRADGTSVATLITARPIDFASGSSGFVYFIRDVSEREAWEARFRHQATHDDLTGLPNRFAFVERLTEANLHDRFGAVICVDLDRFSTVNDVHGHANGDVALATVAQRIAHIVADRGECARIEADEFAILMNTGSLTSGAEVELLALSIVAELREGIAQAIELDGERVHLDACAGIAISESSTSDCVELLRQAEVALNIANRPGTTSVAVHDDAMSHAVERRVHLEQRLRVAIATGQLEMHGQPIVDLLTEQFAGIELLARWRLDGEWVPPDIFIPIAEESGQIQALGRWALAEACSILQRLHDSGSRQSVSVNISGLHLIGGDVADELAELLEGSTFDRALLRVELTESFLLEDPSLAIERLNAIRALGAKIIIDDFGTGYSSLTYLHELPIDGLKLDRSFVSRLGVDHSDETIARMVNDLAQGLGLDLVAEGIETTDQFHRLAEFGYRRGQGWLWSKALPLDELWPRLAEHSGDVAVGDLECLVDGSQSDSGILG